MTNHFSTGQNTGLTRSAGKEQPSWLTRSAKSERRKRQGKSTVQRIARMGGQTDQQLKKGQDPFRSQQRQRAELLSGACSSRTRALPSQSLQKSSKNMLQSIAQLKISSFTPRSLKEKELNSSSGLGPTSGSIHIFLHGYKNSKNSTAKEPKVRHAPQEAFTMEPRNI